MHPRRERGSAAGGELSGASLVPARPRLLALDVDGTLLDADHRVSQRTASALAQVRSHGVVVTIVPPGVNPGRPVIDVFSEAGVSGTRIRSWAAFHPELHVDFAARHYESVSVAVARRSPRVHVGPRVGVR